MQRSEHSSAQQQTHNERKWRTFETLNFDNLVLRTLPIDPITENYVREVKNACFSQVKPTPLNNPAMVVYSKNAMEMLDLNQEQLERKEAVEYLSGNKFIPGSDTAAHCYCGFQFGVFAGQLGDGAAMYLGEVINAKGERWEIQFKGSGLTPYSRTADGRKVLRSSLREFLGSEAMHFLGVATTRAGSCVSSDSTVVRDIFYDGNPKLERCAIILRIAESFIRFGSFEIFRPSDRTTGGRGPSFGRQDILIKMLDYVSNSFYKKETESISDNNELKYEKMFEEVVKRTARLVADWQSVGFVHGVLNTDNMSILGLTIDYGPFGFLERFDPDYVFNGSDHGGRYSFRHQVDICEWNCKKLAEAIQPLLPLAKSTEIIQNLYRNEFKTAYLKNMRQKLGLWIEKEADEKLVEEFLNLMYETGADFTNCFRHLSLLKFSGEQKMEEDIRDHLSNCLNECCSIEELKRFYKPKFPKETVEKILKAIETEPDIINYFGLNETQIRNDVKFAIKYEQIKNYSQERKREMDAEMWLQWLRKYTKRVYEEMSSIQNDTELKQYKSRRIEQMNSKNPRFILRNHLAQDAIEHAEKGQFLHSRILLKLLENPFTNEPIDKIVGDELLSDKQMKQVIESRSKSKFYESGPPPNVCVRLTCSS